jgi:uncharacterized lipoprotein YbaY/heat shock protein HslJ
MEKSETPQNNIWVITGAILVALALVGILVYAMLTTSGTSTVPGPSQPPLSITITEPVQGDNLDLTWAVKVSGQVGGLFEGSLVVQALDAAGNILAQAPATVNTTGAGTGVSESWSVDLSINAQTGSQGQIVAFSPSQGGDSWIAEDRIDVGFGENLLKHDLVRVDEHLWKLVTLNERPPLEDTYLTLQFDRFQAGGFGGCNNFRTSFERSGTRLNFGFVTSTAKECELPAGVMAQESAYFSALEQITTYHIGDTQFTLVDNSGVERLVYDAVVIGTVNGPNDIQLPEDSVISVQLIDNSIADPLSNLINELQIIGNAQLPFSFSLIYNPKRIIDDHVYVVGVQIEDSLGTLLYINSAAIHVITAGNPSIINIPIEPFQ